MDSAPLWVAVLGVMLGAASLTWHVVSFLMTGGRVIISASPDMLLLDARQKSSTPVITLTVRNIGRMPVSVATVWLAVPRTDIRLFVVSNPEVGPRLPCTIEPGHGETWSIHKEAAVEKLRHTLPHESVVSLRPLVVLADGKHKQGKKLSLDVREVSGPEG